MEARPVDSLRHGRPWPMTHRRKITLIAVAAVLLLAGGFAWYWRATAVERRVNDLLDELRYKEPSMMRSWLIQLGLVAERERRDEDEIEADLVAVGPAAVPALIAALQDETLDMRSSVARALGRLGDRGAVEPLIKMLSHEDTDVRTWAAFALSLIGDRRAVEPLMKMLSEEDTDVRRYAAWALGLIGDRRAVEPLESLLSDDNELVRSVAKEALAKLRKGQAER